MIQKHKVLFSYLVAAGRKPYQHSQKRKKKEHELIRHLKNDTFNIHVSFQAQVIF